MIKTLQIRNFQSHKKTDIVFDKGVNVIVGSSDSGKTAILRALRWVLWNKPTGDGFRSNWGGDTKVKININENIISRIKQNTSNFYFLNDLKFAAFGTNVPEEIIKAGNVTEINLQQQLDSPFLLSETPGNVAKHFNKIANIDKIDEVRTRVNREISRIETNLKVKNEKLADYQLELSTIPDLDVLEVELENLEQLELTRNSNNNLLFSLKQLKQSIEKTDILLQEYLPILNLEKEVDCLLDLINQKQQIEKENRLLKIQIQTIVELTEKEQEIQTVILLEKKVNDLLGLIEQKEKKENELKNLISLYSQYGIIADDIAYFSEIIELETETVSLIDLISRRDVANERRATLSVLVEECLTLDAKLLKLQKNMFKMETEFHKNIGKVCPLCGSKITKK